MGFDPVDAPYTTNYEYPSSPASPESTVPFERLRSSNALKCGQVAISASTISAAGPTPTTIKVITSGCTDTLGTSIARACSAAGFPSAAAGSGVIINQNGGVSP